LDNQGFPKEAEFLRVISVDLALGNYNQGAIRLYKITIQKDEDSIKATKIT